MSTPPFSYNMNLDLCFNDEKIKNSKTLPATNPSPHQAKHTWFWCLTSLFWCWKLMNRHHRRWKATKTKHDAVCCWLTNIDAGAWCGSRKVSNLGAGVAIIFICLKHNDILWTCFVAKISALNVLNVKFCVPNYGKVALHGKKERKKRVTLYCQIK